MNLSYLTNLRGRILSKASQLWLQAWYRAGIVPDRNGREIIAFKDRHRGRRAFVIGNGPSLKVADLNRLQGELTFASNKIYLAFDQTEWRPTYYSVCDKLVARNNREAISQLGLTKLFSDRLKPYFPQADDITWLHETARNLAIQHCLDNGEPLPRGHFSRDALQGVDGGWTVIFIQLQMAYYMGITEVVLIGVDFDFTVPDQRAKTDERGYENSVESIGEVNHFHPDYRKPGEAWAVPRMDCQKVVFEIARKHFEQAGRSIINASRSTKLDVLTREDFETVLARGRPELPDSLDETVSRRQKR